MKNGLIIGFLLLCNIISAQSFLSLEDRYFSLTDEGFEYYQKNLQNSVDLTGSEHWPPIYQQTHWVCNQTAASYYMLSYETNLIKDLSSQVPENCFSVYFPWNFGNGGSGWFGDNYVITMEMIKNFGVPKLSDCSIDISKDSSKWISGYDFYYNAMHNRIKDYYGIKVNTQAGILTLKSWIYNHGGGENFGGTATFLANIAEGGATFFESGTAEAGAYVITKCGNDALHARTIVGFNDDVCYDYNGDGEYTNNLDINDDGVVDVRDWEKGGFKLAESFGPLWQGDGYCWIMYKAMADEYGDGGILNNTVHVIIPKIDYQPLLTMKFEIKHPSRERIKIKVGISSDPDAVTYEYLKEFPLFNYQGGNKYMQGGMTENDKTLEAGLDITSLLEYFNEESCAKIFLIVDEFDESGAYDGWINSCSVIDYSGSTPIEYEGLSNVELQSNSSTVIPINVCAANVSNPKILTESLPMFSNSGSTWYELDFEGGTAPYEWEILPYYEVSTSNVAFDNFSGAKLTPNSYFNGAVTQSIPFNFPFDGKSSNELKIHTDGYVFPFSTTSVWTQFREHLYPFFINEKVIAPLARFSMVNDYDEGNGIWYSATSDTVKIRWQCADQYVEPWTVADFGCNLMANGDIEFYYGDTYLRNLFSNIGGVSFGNQSDNIICWQDEVPAKNTKIKISPYPVPTGLSISSDGVLYGTLGEFTNYPFKVKITDANGISNTVDYLLSTNIEDEIKDGNNIIVFPNPVLNTVDILVNSESDAKAIVEVFDCTGRLLDDFSISTNTNTQVDFTNYKSGMYILVVNLNGTKTTKNLLKI